MTSPWNLARADVLIDGRRIATGHVGEGPPLVLVHGTPAHSIVWRNVIPACRDAGFSVHWFDLLGFGESECPVDADTSVAEQARLLQRLLGSVEVGGLQARLPALDVRQDGLRDLKVAVNLSAIQFRQPQLPEIINSILQDTGIPPDSLELELTEGVAVDDPMRPWPPWTNYMRAGCGCRWMTLAQATRR